MYWAKRITKKLYKEFFKDITKNGYYGDESRKQYDFDPHRLVTNCADKYDIKIIQNG